MSKSSTTDFTPTSFASTPNGVSPSHTVVDIPGQIQEAEKKWQRDEEAQSKPISDAESQKEASAGAKAMTTGAELKISQKRKWFLLFIFSVAQYLDIASFSGLFVFTDPILVDLNISYETSSWIITAYSVTFAACLLPWGRVADLYSAKSVFAWGFLLLGLLNLIISFITNRFAYFVFRALSGVAGAATIPSAFRLILAVFEPHELSIALTLFGLSGALANVTGLVLGGFFGFIKAEGQMAAWRWFFRMITIVIVPFAVLAFALVPKTKGDRAGEVEEGKWKRIDLFGGFLMFASIVMLILGLTLGASVGFKTAHFIVPFLLTWPLLIAFFIWEYRIPASHALIPPSTWKIPNLTILIIFALGIYPWWVVNQLPLVERFETIFHEQPIIAAVRMLPEGIAALATAMAIQPILEKLGSPRIPIATGMVIGAAAYLLFIFTPNGDIHNNEYWRWTFPAMIVGSGAAMASFLGTNIAVMTSVPPSMSGVAGALLQVSLQVGSVIGLSVQAGLLTREPGLYSNYTNIQTSFWFQFGWSLFNVILFLAFFRPNKAAEGSERADIVRIQTRESELARQRTRERQLSRSQSRNSQRSERTATEAV